MKEGSAFPLRDLIFVFSTAVSLVQWKEMTLRLPVWTVNDVCLGPTISAFVFYVWRLWRQGEGGASGREGRAPCILDLIPSPELSSLTLSPLGLTLFLSRKKWSQAAKKGGFHFFCSDNQEWPPLFFIIVVNTISNLYSHCFASVILKVYDVPNHFSVWE